MLTKTLIRALALVAVFAFTAVLTAEASASCPGDSDKPTEPTTYCPGDSDKPTEPTTFCPGDGDKPSDPTT
jgi:ACGX-repeat protein